MKNMIIDCLLDWGFFFFTFLNENSIDNIKFVILPFLNIQFNVALIVSTILYNNHHHNFG